jgi:hypothetical protein
MARDYQTKINDPDVADSITATKLGAGETNSALSEITNSVLKSGQTPAVQDGTSEIFTQIATAQFINGISAQTFQDSGIADAYIVTPITGSGGLVVPTDYAQMNGAIISFLPAFANTGASTLDFGQTAGSLLGAKAIIQMTTAPLAPGLIDTNHYHEFIYSVALNSWLFIGKKRAADPVTGLFDAYGKWSDTKASTTDGGTFTQGAWRTRDLNTEDSDSEGMATIAANQITLEAGTYVCSAQAPGFKVNKHATRLYDTTGAAVLLNGTSCDSTSSTSMQTASLISGKFTIAVQSVLEVQHYCNSTQATTGFGNPSDIGGRDEVYATIELWRVL